MSWPRRSPCGKAAGRPIPAVTPGPIATCSSTFSSAAWSSTRGCCSGWPGSGTPPDASSSARSAFVLAGQLSDEQYAVPSHPFTVALATRSLHAAQGCSWRAKPPAQKRDVVGLESARSIRVKRTGPGGATLVRSSCARVRARTVRHGVRHFFADFADPLASAFAAGFLAGAFFSSAFFFLAVSRASPIARFSS